MKKGWKNTNMELEAYYETNNVITGKDYKKMIDSVERSPKGKLGRKNCIRKIYFNDDINYLEDADDSNRDVYSIVMIDGDMDHLMVEKKSRRDGIVYKSYAPLEKSECDRLLRGDVRWLRDSIYPVLNSLYLEVTINQLRVGVVVEYEREKYRLNGTEDYIEFDFSIRSVYGRRLEVLSSELPMKERLEPDHIVMTYKQSVSMPKFMEKVFKLASTTV